jgi:hypothetical protein
MWRTALIDSLTAWLRTRLLRGMVQVLPSIMQVVIDYSVAQKWLGWAPIRELVEEHDRKSDMMLTMPAAVALRLRLHL